MVLSCKHTWFLLSTLSPYQGWGTRSIFGLPLWRVPTDLMPQRSGSVLPWHQPPTSLYRLTRSWNTESGTTPSSHNSLMSRRLFKRTGHSYNKAVYQGTSMLLLLLFSERERERERECILLIQLVHDLYIHSFRVFNSIFISSLQYSILTFLFFQSQVNFKYLLYWLSSCCGYMEHKSHEHNAVFYFITTFYKENTFIDNIQSLKKQYEYNKCFWLTETPLMIASQSVVKKKNVYLAVHSVGFHLWLERRVLNQSLKEKVTHQHFVTQNPSKHFLLMNNEGPDHCIEAKTGLLSGMYRGSWS